jgi:hypothetical protein
MTPSQSPPAVRIGISNAESDNHLVMMIASDSHCEFHHLTLAQARAVSLEIIKNVYQAEMRKNMNISQPSSHFGFQLQRHERLGA